MEIMKTNEKAAEFLLQKIGLKLLKN